MIGKVLGNLKIVSKIGEGGMGIVYLAQHLTLKRQFAVKSLTAKLTEDAGFRERFYQEAVNQSLLDHPNIVQVTDFFDEDGQFFLVMEYVSGQGLNDLIKAAGKLSEKETLRIFKDLLRGLNFAHSKGVIHRDIKPANVIVDEEGRARITDFGIAILAGEKRLSNPGATVGTSWYMSPEQIVHPREIDHRSDVYSAGIVLYEMLTGDVPFDGETEFTIQNKQVKDPVPDPVKKNALISSELKKIMMKALEKDPDRRYSGCGEFLELIEAYEKGKPPASPAPRWNLLIALVTVVAVTGIIVVYYKFKPPTPIVIIQENVSEDAYNWIKSATENASKLCIDITVLEKLQREAQIAIDATKDDTAFHDALKKKLTDRENNINEYLDIYQEYIEKLGPLEKTIVDKALSKYNDSLAQKELYGRIKIAQIVARHYREANEKAPSDINIKTMGELCPKQ